MGSNGTLKVVQIKRGRKNRGRQGIPVSRGQREERGGKTVDRMTRDLDAVRMRDGLKTGVHTPAFQRGDTIPELGRAVTMKVFVKQRKGGNSSA